MRARERVDVDAPRGVVAAEALLPARRFQSSGVRIEARRKCGIVSCPSRGTSASRPCWLITMRVVSVSAINFSSNQGLIHVVPENTSIRSKLKKRSACSLLAIP